MVYQSETRSSHIVVIFTFTVLIVHAFCWRPFSAPLPFILLHGINSQCSSSEITGYVKRLSEWSNTTGFCLEIGNGIWSSWVVPLEKQVKAMKELKKGYNIVGLSQGTLIGRGIVEFCEGAPPVNNFISIGGPQAGIASVPHHTYTNISAVRGIANNILRAGVYSDYAQNQFAPSGYTKIPENMKGYLKSCKFLPKLNNERPDDRNPVYKRRFTGLKNLILIMSENETIIKPKESSWFGFYKDGNTKKILQPRQTKLYIEDWIGLKALDKAGRVKFIKVAGVHIELSDVDTKKYVVPYLQKKWRRVMESGDTEAEHGGAEAVTTTTTTRNLNGVREYSNKLEIIKEGNM
ncbi:hypothetical protein ACP275_01G106700 [Erythranthe tilingii]